MDLRFTRYVCKLAGVAMYLSEVGDCLDERRPTDDHYISIRHQVGKLHIDHQQINTCNNPQHKISKLCFSREVTRL